MSMRRILYLVTTDAYFLSHRLPMALAAKKAGFDVLVAAKDTGFGTTIQSHGLTFIPLHKLKRTGQNPLQDLSALRELVAIYKKYRPDVVHHVALKPVLYGSLAAFFARVPKTVNALTGLGYLFISKKWSVRLIRSMVMIFFRWLFNRPNSVLILQNRDDYAKFHAFVPKDKLALIRGSGVDTKTFVPAQTKPKNTPLKVALVARMLWDKGVGESIDAVRLLREQGAPIDLILCGDPDPENPRSIDEKALKGWQAEGLCQWIGHQKDVVALYHDVDIALLPSYREGLPKSLLEAASCGLPIVTSDVPGCREVVEEGKNGFLMPLDSKAIAGALEKLTNDPKLRTTMGAYSRTLAVDHFSVEKICTETVDVYG